jgi:hypothetical protein
LAIARSSGDSPIEVNSSNKGGSIRNAKRKLSRILLRDEEVEAKTIEVIEKPFPLLWVDKLSFDSRFPDA